jgi:uncharacterized protein
MDYPSLNPDSARKNRIQAFLEVVLMSGLISSILAAFPFYLIPGKRAVLTSSAISTSIFLLIESGIAFLILAMLMNQHQERLRDLGLQWKQWRPNVLTGIILVPFLFLINALIGFVFRVYFPKYYLATNPLTEIIRTPLQLGLFIFSALIAGGIKEELQRAFILTRFRDYLGGSLTGLIVWSLAFGASHYVQHLQGMVVATIYGFILGLIYLISGSLIAPIVAHSIYDTLALLGYWYLSGHFK